MINTAQEQSARQWEVRATTVVRKDISAQDASQDRLQPYMIQSPTQTKGN